MNGRSPAHATHLVADGGTGRKLGGVGVLRCGGTEGSGSGVEPIAQLIKKKIPTSNSCINNGSRNRYERISSILAFSSSHPESKKESPIPRKPSARPLRREAVHRARPPAKTRGRPSRTPPPAPPRPLPRTGVRADVFLQVARRLEGLVARLFRTLVRLLAGVDACVTLQAVARRERLAAAALERTVARVRPLVHLRRATHESVIFRPWTYL